MQDLTKKAKIALEDGTVFTGVSFGALGECSGELVFNTSMSGYQEILTDPSYKGQIVAMTYPLIGNYGVNTDDVESAKLFLAGFIVRERNRITSNWRSLKSLSEYLQENNIPGVEGIDTRALARHIRVYGAMKTVISTIDLDDKSLVEKAVSSAGLVGRDLVADVAAKKQYQWNKEGHFHVVVLDCGVKFNILRLLAENDCRVTVVPYHTGVEDIFALSPDGLFISNGPGDPQGVLRTVDTVRSLIGKLPVFGICLGHQILGLAMGAQTYKLKFGHHGGNHPVKDLRSGKIAITVQNHGFCVDIKSLRDRDIEITHLNLNDNTLEGIRHKTLPVFSVQFHPEASPGPHEARYLFKEFTGMMRGYA